MTLQILATLVHFEFVDKKYSLLKYKPMTLTYYANNNKGPKTDPCETYDNVTKLDSHDA